MSGLTTPLAMVPLFGIWGAHHTELRSRRYITELISDLIEGREFMQYAGACADNSLPVAPHIPREPYARGEIVVITVVGGSLPAADLYESGGSVRIEVAKEVVCLREDRLQFVAQAEVHGECGPDAIVVLNEERVIFVMQIPHGLSHENGGPFPYVS